MVAVDIGARHTVAAAVAAADTVVTTVLHEGEAAATEVATVAAVEEEGPTVLTRGVDICSQREGPEDLLLQTREQMAQRHSRLYNMQ